MSSKKRLRDRLFPEGGKLRSWLRTLNRFFHSIIKPSYIKEQVQSIKKNGWKATFAEMKRYMVMGTLAEPEDICHSGT